MSGLSAFASRSNSALVITVLHSAPGAVVAPFGQSPCRVITGVLGGSSFAVFAASVVGLPWALGWACGLGCACEFAGAAGLEACGCAFAGAAGLDVCACAP